MEPTARLVSPSVVRTSVRNVPPHLRLHPASQFFVRHHAGPERGRRSGCLLRVERFSKGNSVALTGHSRKPHQSPTAKEVLGDE